MYINYKFYVLISIKRFFSYHDLQTRKIYKVRLKIDSLTILTLGFTVPEEYSIDKLIDWLLYSYFNTYQKILLSKTEKI